MRRGRLCVYWRRRRTESTIIIAIMSTALPGCMGSGPSKKGDCLGRRRPSEEDEGLKLPGTNLHFSKEQLHRLNLVLIRLQNDIQHDDLYRDRAQAAVEVVVERLVQRLVCGAGMLDRRFASKFLVRLEQGPKFRYLVRLDALSDPPLHPDVPQSTCKIVEGFLGGDGIPQGFAKIRVQGEDAEQWAEFVNQYGFLRRDKLQERFVELLAQAAARVSEPTRPDQVDESMFCGSPGKIVDAGVLEQILRVPPDRQVFYGPADCNQSRYPDPRDFRIAIVEGAPQVSLRIGFLSPALASAGRSEDVEVKLVLAVGFSGWPQTCDFPLRSSLGHVDCLLFHRAAQTGFYVVPGPPHPTVRCDDRTASWQIWLPAAEMSFLTHHASTSVPGRVLSVAEAALYQLRGHATRQMLGGFGLPSSYDQEYLKVTSRYMLKTLLWFQLEKHVAGPAGMLLAWTPDKLAAHVITLLDTLVVALRTQRFRSYFFPWCNVMLHAVSGSGHHPEEEYLKDAEIILKFLKSLHEESSVTALPPDDDAETQKFLTRCKLESALVRKWKDVVCDLAPPATTRSRRLSFSSTSPETGYTTAGASQYTSRQLSYIGYVCREMLKVRQLTLQSAGSPAWLQSPFGNSTATVQHDEPVEDLIYLLSSIIEQAKEQHLGEKSVNVTAHCRRNRKRSTKAQQTSKRRKSEINSKFRKNYDSSLALLIDAVRRDLDTSSANLNDDVVLVKYVLQWLYRAMDDDKKTLGPVLRPYLNGLFAASHENGWHLEEWRRKNSDEERESLGIFCRLVSSDQVPVVDALLDAASKGWTWAKNVLETAEILRDSSEGPIENYLQLIFTPFQTKAIRHTITLPPRYCVEDVVPRTEYESRSSASSTMKSSYSCGASSANTTKSKKATLKRASTTLPALITQQTRAHFSPEELTLRLERLSSSSRLGHCRLRDTSPYTIVSDSRRRYGQHRGVGDLVQALVTLNKFSVLQDISSLLPDGERSQMLDAIQKLSRESRRAVAARRAAAKKLAINDKNERKFTSAYRPNNELQASNRLKSAASSSEENDTELAKKLREMKLGDTLLGTCRAARSQQAHGRSLRSSAFFDSPLGRELTLCSPFSASTLNRDGVRYASVSLLQLTEDKQLRLSTPDETQDLRYDDRPPPVRKRDVVTKL